MPFRDDDYGQLDPREYPEPDSEDGSADVVACPGCREWVYEEAEQCPACGQALTPADHLSGRPWWVIAVAVFLLIWSIWFLI
jgi:uncharacterized paraquat-inducible protein A